MAQPAVVGKAAEAPVVAVFIAEPEASDCSRCCGCLRLGAARSSSKTSSIFSLLLVLLAWLAAVLAVYVSRNSFPTPQAAAPGVFSEVRAMTTLEEIQRIGAHPVLWSLRATAPNVAVFEHFRQQLLAIQAESSHVVELRVPISGRIVREAKAYDWLAARLRVPSSYEKALLLTAHFDSVVPEGVRDDEAALNEMGEGMADDAVGCAVVLETFRALATAEEAPLVDVILVLTNGEELGHVGLDSFMSSSAWANDVGFFIQMDQSGSKGHALAVFGGPGSGELMAASAYYAGAVRPYTSVLLKDFEPWEEMNTDGTRLRGVYGLPGVGMYMMEDRCPYHTIYDDLSHIVPGNLQAHGDNFLGISLAVTRTEQIRETWARSDSDLSGQAYTIDFLSSSMLLLTPGTMAVLYGIVAIWLISVLVLVARIDLRGHGAAWSDMALLALAHMASIASGLLLTMAMALCVGGNFGYWYQRDAMAVWLYMMPSLCMQLLYGRLLLLKRFRGELLEWRSSMAALVVMLVVTLALALAGLHMSLLFGLCCLTRLSGVSLRLVIHVLVRWKQPAWADASEWLGEGIELCLASLGSIYLLDAMRFAVVNFTTSYGQEGALLPGDLPMGLYVGLFGSMAILQSSGVQVLSWRCLFSGQLLLMAVAVSTCLFITALALPVHEKYPCVVPGVL